MMRISTPTEIDNIAWEGTLRPLGPTFMSGGRMPKVTIGEPTWWPVAEAMERETGQPWTPPISDRQFLLVRIVCTLHPPQDRLVQYKDAKLTTYLRPKGTLGVALAHDLYPQKLTVESKRAFSVGVGPDLKFAHLVEVGLAQVGFEIEYNKAFPVVQGYGLGESAPYWQFNHHTSQPLLGCQSMYLVVAMPADAQGIRLSIELVANVQTKLGVLSLGIPQEGQTHISRVIEV